MQPKEEDEEDESDNRTSPAFELVLSPRPQNPSAPADLKAVLIQGFMNNRLFGDGPDAKVSERTPVFQGRSVGY